jgi:hypothetical protein
MKDSRGVSINLAHLIPENKTNLITHPRNFVRILGNAPPYLDFARCLQQSRRETCAKYPLLIAGRQYRA